MNDGTTVEDPKDPTLLFTVANVIAVDTLAVPSTADRVAVASPVKLKLRAVAHFVAVEALPDSAPYTVPTFRSLFKFQRSSADVYVNVAFAPATVRPAPLAALAVAAY